MGVRSKGLRVERRAAGMATVSASPRGDRRGIVPWNYDTPRISTPRRAYLSSTPGIRAYTRRGAASDTAGATAASAVVALRGFSDEQLHEELLRRVKAQRM